MVYCIGIAASRHRLHLLSVHFTSLTRCVPPSSSPLSSLRVQKSQEAERRFAVFSEAASIAAYKLRNKLQEAAAKLAQQGQFAAEEATYLGTEAAHARQEAFAARERAARESQLAQSQVEAANRAVVEAGSAAAREREQAAVYAKSQAEREVGDEVD